MKKTTISLLLGLCLTLSGCSVAESQMMDRAGIESDTQYQVYQTYMDGGKLTNEGYYSESAFEAETRKETLPEGTAHISLSTNNQLKIRYYSDAERTVMLEGNSQYLKPGDCIFAEVEVSDNVASSEYTFSGFRIYKYTNKRELIETVIPGTDGMVLSITDEHIGVKLSIEPIGNYGTRSISLRDYYTDDNDTEHNLSGTWLVDDQEITGDSVEINPVSSYIISYKFDSNEYFYLSSTPQCFYSNNEDGVVIFEKRESTDETCDYSVELHKYITVSLETAVDRQVSVNNGPAQTVKAGNGLEISKLKYGDSITILTNKEWAALETYRMPMRISEEKIGNQYRYVLTVPQKGGEFVFDPSEYKYEHGEIVFSCFGSEVTAPQYLSVGSIITYYANDVDPGYWLPDGDHVIIVTTEEETRQALNAIRFASKTQVQVHLSQPEYGGKIIYKDGNKVISGSTYTCFSNSVISMEFEAWEGWINNYSNGATYTVTDRSNQELTIGGKSVNGAFKEDPNHKPALTIVFDKSVDEDLVFNYIASGHKDKDLHYVSNWTGKYTAVEGIKIGTEKGISFSMGGVALKSGTAVKITVEKTDSEKNKTTEYCLINNLAAQHPDILIYNDTELGTSSVWYKSIVITISIVDAYTFTEPADPQNVTITVRDSQKTLQTGDLIEGAEEITVTIRPTWDYYITGKNIKDNQYQKTMKYSTYLADIQSIISDHPVQRYVHITLDSDDNYGTSTYLLDGKPVSGTIRVMEGQKLTLKYKITNADYVIEGGVLLGKKETTADISITRDLDGKTINRGSFGINVVKGE